MSVPDEYMWQTVDVEEATETFDYMYTTLIQDLHELIKEECEGSTLYRYGTLNGLITFCRTNSSAIGRIRRRIASDTAEIIKGLEEQGNEVMQVWDSGKGTRHNPEEA